MAVRTDAASDYLLRSANLPSSTAFTVCGWAVMDVDTDTDTTLATLENALTAATSGYYLTTGATGTELIVYSTALPGASATLISMAVGTPFFWAMSANGAGAGLLKVSARTASENSLTSVTNTSGSFTSAALYIGNEGYGLAKPFDGRHWNVKCWDRALTDAELLVESFFDRVMYPSSLNFHLPLHDVNDTSDRSGNGRDATVGGTLTSGDSISNLWKPSPKFWTLQTTLATSRPSAITAGTWTDEAGGTLTVTDVNDASDSTGAKDPAGASYPVLAFTMDTPMAASVSQTCYFRGNDVAAGKQVRQVLFANDGTTVVATGAWKTMTGSLATYSDVLTPTATAYKGEIQTQAA